MRIKCFLTLIAISFTLCIPAQAQEEIETRHEISISYGWAANSDWLGLFDEGLDFIGGTRISRNQVGPIGLEYYYNISPKIGVGGIGIFCANKQDMLFTAELQGVRHRYYFSLMPSVKFNWLRRAKWGLYSKIGIGATWLHNNYTGPFEDDDFDSVILNFQASLIGIEGGGTHVRAFAEAGMGEQGVLLGGVRFRF